MRISVNRSRAGASAFAVSNRSSASVHGPSFGRGWTSRHSENAVSPDRRIRRTVLRDRCRVRADLLDRLPLAQMLAPYPTDRLHNQHPPPPASRQSRQPTKPEIGGSILDADDAPQGVNFARRNAIAAVMADLTAFSTAGRMEIGVITAIAAAAVVAFVVQERRSPEPMISLELWGRRPIAAVNASSLFAGMVIIGLTTFLPVFVQGVMQRPPLVAGFALSAMVLGWPIGATLSPRIWARVGVRALVRGGSALIPLGALVFVFLKPGTPPWVAGVGSAIVGFGMGLSSSASIVLIQEIVDWSERGSVTASYLFARTLGSTFGATVFGAVLNMGLMRSGMGAVTSDELRRLLEGGAAAANAGLRSALETSLHVTFVSMFVVAVLVALTAALVPKVVFAARRALAE